MFTLSTSPAPGELRKFGVTVLIGLGVIGLLIWWLKPPVDPAAGLSVWRSVAIVLWGIGVCVAALSFLVPRAGRYVYVGWMGAALALGAAMTRVLLTVLFVVLLPIFALIRFRDPLRKRMEAETYWEEYDRHEATLDRVLRPF